MGNPVSDFYLQSEIVNHSVFWLPRIPDSNSSLGGMASSHTQLVLLTWWGGFLTRGDSFLTGWGQPPCFSHNPLLLLMNYTVRDFDKRNYC